MRITLMPDRAYESFGEVRARLDEIVAEVRNKDLSLEKSLDLYEEAIKLGNKCAELVDKPDFTEEEAAQLTAQASQAKAADQEEQEADREEQDMREDG